jgi:hypothetical protein
VIAAVLGAAALAQPGGQGSAAGSPAVHRRGGQPERGEQQQRREQRAAQLACLGERTGDPGSAEQRERRLRPVGAQRVPPRGLLSGLRGAQEGGLLGEQGEHRCPGYHERRGLPDEERADRVPP